MDGFILFLLSLWKPFLNNEWMLQMSSAFVADDYKCKDVNRTEWPGRGRVYTCIHTLSSSNILKLIRFCQTCGRNSVIYPTYNYSDEKQFLCFICGLSAMDKRFWCSTYTKHANSVFKILKKKEKSKPNYYISFPIRRRKITLVTSPWKHFSVSNAKK